MRRKRTVATGLACLTFGLVCLSSCEEERIYGHYTHPDFTTEYTIEEHIARIEKRTRQKYAEEIECGYIQDFTVDIVYAYYDNDPEYFLIEFSLLEELEDEDGNTLQWHKSAHMIGCIYEDTYWTGAYGYYASRYVDRSGGREFKTTRPFTAWIETPSVWKAVGLEKEKKYYGKDKYGVKTKEGILSLGTAQFFASRKEYYYKPSPDYKKPTLHKCVVVSAGKDSHFESPFQTGYELLAYRRWETESDSWLEPREGKYSYRVMTNEDLAEYVNGEISKNKIFTKKEEKLYMKGNFYRPNMDEY